jgi:hypothetical protein
MIIGGSLIQLIITAIVLAGVIGIAIIAIRAAGLNIPPWVIQIFWIVVIVVVAVFAIRFLMGSVRAHYPCPRSCLPTSEPSSKRVPTTAVSAIGATGISSGRSPTTRTAPTSSRSSSFPGWTGDR